MPSSVMYSTTRQSIRPVSYTHLDVYKRQEDDGDETKETEETI